MQITRTVKPNGTAKELAVWHCSGCGVVHLSVGGNLLNISQDEFSAFAESIADIQYPLWQMTEPVTRAVDLGSGRAEGDGARRWSVH